MQIHKDEQYALEGNFGGMFLGVKEFDVEGKRSRS